MMKIDYSLLEKYNVPVPRYTSYPPANHFIENIGDRDLIELISKSNLEGPSHLAFYIHIPYCQKICHYCGCNSCSLGKGDTVDDYIKALKQEIEMVTSNISAHRKISQIHFGGGTPNAISINYLKDVIDLLTSKFSLSAGAEIAIECNPSFFTPEHLQQLKDSGFNRFSIGIQDFNREVLHNVNRDPSAMPLDKVISILKDGNTGIAVNLDFIYGLPGQDVYSFGKTISEAISLRPDRLVTFSYAHVPWLKKNQVILEKRGIPGPRLKTEMFFRASKLLTNAGYMPVGLDHYVLQNDELYRALQDNVLHRNFQGYCTRRTTGQVYAFGVSSISQLDSAYIQNVKSVGDYIDIINRGRLPVEKGMVLTSVQKGTREAITGLMCNKKLIWSELASKLGVEESGLSRYININDDEIRTFEKDGILLRNSDGINITENGSMLIRNVAASIDPGFTHGGKKYSKSV